MIDLPAKQLPAFGLPNPDVTSGFGAYVHIPFCRVRCGYCDFNTYTNTDFGPGAKVSDYQESVAREIELSSHQLTAGGDPSLTSIFFGGGTPTMLNATQLVAIMRKLRETFGVVNGAEITTEANPESVNRDALETLKNGDLRAFRSECKARFPTCWTLWSGSTRQGRYAK
ncbi:Oxygen-independent coproporphyrinogen-III oxidase [Arcanobacterium haemolyticum]|nr:radical SAM protein [Arcanobacterium haemolyticum]SPT75481.1 Oxygen-independent coproporphyrinogen-III oxidase [Arcanobacterium haemolyticum]